MGAPTYYLANFFPKIAWKWKKLDQGVRVPGAPLRSASDNSAEGSRSGVMIMVQQNSVHELLGLK